MKYVILLKIKLLEEDIIALKNYGLNLGMVYQIIDHCLDGDCNAIKNNITIENAQKFATKANDAINNLESSVYKQGLISLLNYVFASSNTETKRA